jgi:RNA polymerase sigma-70 factor (ECF subfamily)
MQGSREEADDALQEAWLRLGRADRAGVENLGGWLTTVVARVCLDAFRSRKARREEPLGDGPTEGLAAPAAAPVVPLVDAEGDVLLADALGPALLVVLETLAPAERLAFVLHDTFAVPFDEVAPIVGRSPEAARQLASRARRRVQGVETAAGADRARRRELVDAFLAASREGDFDALLALLAPDAVLRADEAAVRASAAARSSGAPSFAPEVRGAAAVARTFSGRAAAARPALVAGAPGAAWAPGGRPRAAFLFTIAHDVIVAIELVAEPTRVAQLDVELDPPGGVSELGRGREPPGSVRAGGGAPGANVRAVMAKGPRARASPARRGALGKRAAHERRGRRAEEGASRPRRKRVGSAGRRTLRFAACMKNNNASFKLGEFAGAPVFAHWSLPIGMLWASHFRFEPGTWFGLAALVLLHEAGHALLVRRARRRVVAIVLHGFGGECRYEGAVTPRQRAVIAWGGVLAQALALAACLALTSIVGGPRDAFTADLVSTFTAKNLWLIGLNLLPFAPFDGAHAWRLPAVLWRAPRRRARAAAVAHRLYDRGVVHPREYFRYRERPAGEGAAAVDRAVLDEVRRILDRAAKGGPAAD